MAIAQRRPVSPMVHHAIEGVKGMQRHLSNASRHISTAVGYLRQRPFIGILAPAKSVPEHQKRIGNAMRAYMQAVGGGNPSEIHRRKEELARALHSLQTVYFQIEGYFRQASHEVAKAREELR